MSDQEKPALVENMLLLRKEDFDELLDRAAECQHRLKTDTAFPLSPIEN